MAIYLCQEQDYDSWDLDSDLNIRDPHPDHSSFESAVDEDKYIIDEVSVNSRFSFTVHLDAYYDYNQKIQMVTSSQTLVPSISIRST